MRKSILKLIIAFVFLLLIMTIIGSILIYCSDKVTEEGYTNKGLDYNSGSLRHEFKDIGPGHIEIDAVKVITSWEKKEGFIATLRNSTGVTKFHFEGTFHDDIGDGFRESNWDYYVIREQFIILERGDYSLDIKGLREHSRDHLQISACNYYTINKKDFSLINGSYYHKFIEGKIESIQLRVSNRFPIVRYSNDPPTTNVKAELLDEEGNSIHQCTGRLKEGSSKGEYEGEKEGFDYIAYLLGKLVMDSYEIDECFKLHQHENCTLRISGLSSESTGSIFITIKRDPYVSDRLVMKESEFLIDDIVVFLTSTNFILGTLGILSILPLIGLILLYRKYQGIGTK